MRRAGAAAGALIVATALPAHAAASDRTVDYQGLRITVPSGWPVRTLGRHSGECLRLDRHAVYLGAAGGEQSCPAHRVGRTETLHVEPLNDQTASFVSSMLARSPRSVSWVAGMPGLSVQDASAGEVRIAVPKAHVLLTGSYGAHPSDLRRLIETITAVPEDLSSERRGVARRWVTGNGFDTCTAPKLAAMRAWRKHFVAANVYIGGPARACPDGRLSRAWVTAVRSMGWRLIPTYVGPQAPCNRIRPRFTLSNAALAGQISAADAADRAMALGLPPSSPIYLDLEAYSRRSGKCRRAVLTFLDSWTRGMRVLGYMSGVYSSGGSGIRDLGAAEGIAKPAAIWFAHWDKKRRVSRDKYMHPGWWPGHRRIKQYRGDHFEKHGHYRLHVDSDAVDGYVR